jgi:hypothetical protein
LAWSKRLEHDIQPGFYLPPGRLHKAIGIVPPGHTGRVTLQCLLPFPEYDEPEQAAHERLASTDIWIGSTLTDCPQLMQDFVTAGLRTAWCRAHL